MDKLRKFYMHGTVIYNFLAVLQMVALDLNPPVKHARLVPVRLPVILGKLINKTLTTDNWHREHGRSTEAKQKETATTGRSRPESPKEARRLSAS